MATGSNDVNGIWLHGEDDSYATFSERLNKGQTSVSTAFTTLRNDLNKAIVTKVRRSAAWPIANDVNIDWDGQMIALSGSWAATPNPSRLVLPKLGYWRVEGSAVGTGMDQNLLRAYIRLNGVEVADSHVETNGTAGKNDPHVRVSTIVAVTNVADYVTVAVSSEAAGKQLRAAHGTYGPYSTLAAVWLGTV